MLEKRFIAVVPQTFTADGSATGIVSIADTSLFKVKQQVIVNATGQVTLDQLEVKRVLTPTTMIVGPQGGAITTFTDVSAYTVALGGNVSANEQRRPNIIADDFERAVYAEEPTVAKRVLLVDPFGNEYDASNPLPTNNDVDIQYTYAFSNMQIVTVVHNLKRYDLDLLVLLNMDALGSYNLGGYSVGGYGVGTQIAGIIPTPSTDYKVAVTDNQFTVILNSISSGIIVYWE